MATARHRRGHHTTTTKESIMQSTTPIKFNVARPTPRAATDLANCNHCGAQIGERCYTPSGRPTKAHTARIERAWSLEINRAHLKNTYH